jgi:DNA repair exonuclease SbcCD nuclease subunit
MRILVIGDQHFRYELPYASAFEDGRRGEWEAVKRKIIDTAETCDAVVLLGDNFNSKHNHSSVIKEFVGFLNEFGDKEVHILAGNHERYGTSTALDFLKGVKKPNWKIYTEPTGANVGGASAMMIPFMTPALLGKETKEEGVQAIIDKFPKDVKFHLAFAHHGVSGATVHGMPIDLFNEIILPGKIMESKFHHTFAGHIHEKSSPSDKITMTGNIFTNEMGEHGKSVWVWEKNQNFPDGSDEPEISMSIEEIPLPVRGIYKTVWEELNDADNIPKNSIVKCYVTNRETDLSIVRTMLSTFDASMIIEQYPNERSKMHFDDGTLDLSVENLLKEYAEAKGLSHDDLKEGFELIK